MLRISSALRMPQVSKPSGKLTPRAAGRHPAPHAIELSGLTPFYQLIIKAKPKNRPIYNAIPGKGAFVPLPDAIAWLRDTNRTYERSCKPRLEAQLNRPLTADEEGHAFAAHALQRGPLIHIFDTYLEEFSGPRFRLITADHHGTNYKKSSARVNTLLQILGKLFLLMKLTRDATTSDAERCRHFVRFYPASLLPQFLEIVAMAKAHRSSHGSRPSHSVNAAISDFFQFLHPRWSGNNMFDFATVSDFILRTPSVVEQGGLPLRMDDHHSFILTFHYLATLSQFEDFAIFGTTLVDRSRSDMNLRLVIETFLAIAHGIDGILTHSASSDRIDHLPAAEQARMVEAAIAHIHNVYLNPAFRARHTQEFKAEQASFIPQVHTKRVELRTHLIGLGLDADRVDRFHGQSFGFLNELAPGGIMAKWSAAAMASQGFDANRSRIRGFKPAPTAHSFLRLWSGRCVTLFSIVDGQQATAAKVLKGGDLKALWDALNAAEESKAKSLGLPVQRWGGRPDAVVFYYTDRAGQTGSLLTPAEITLVAMEHGFTNPV